MSTSGFYITGGQVYLNSTLQNVALGIENGEIAEITDNDSVPSNAETHKLDGEYVIPGLVDGHVHLREPGYEEKEGIKTGTAAAAAGGITTIVEMPNTTPPVLTIQDLNKKRTLFDEKSHVDYALFGAVTDENVGTGDIRELADAGVTAFKTFMATSFGPLLMDDKGVLFRAFEEIADTGLPIYIHAEDQEYLNEFRDSADDLSGMDAFLSSRPPIAETTAIADVIEIVRETDAETVIPHITTSEGVELVTRAREDGVPIQAEVTPYHLAIDQNKLKDIGTVGIGTPPVRGAENKHRLNTALESGKIQLIGSDHAPHTLSEKQRPPIEVAPGMPQLETALPVLFDAVFDGRLSLSRVVDAYATEPAKRHGLFPRKGTIRIGSDADLVIVDPDRETVIDAREFESTAPYNPFDGWTLTGCPISVYQRGELIAREGQCLATPGDGMDL